MEIKELQIITDLPQVIQVEPSISISVPDTEQLLQLLVINKFWQSEEN